MGVRARVGFKDNVGVQNGQRLPMQCWAPLASAAPLATNCWPATLGGGGWRPRTLRVGTPVLGPCFLPLFMMVLRLLVFVSFLSNRPV